MFRGRKCWPALMGSTCRRQSKHKCVSADMAVQKEMETWRKAREVGEREERSYTDTAAGLPIPKVAVEVRASPVWLTCTYACNGLH